MVNLGPVSWLPAGWTPGPEAVPVVEVPAELTDDDLAWVNRHALGAVEYVRGYPPVDLRPDPRICQTVLR